MLIFEAKGAFSEEYYPQVQGPYCFLIFRAECLEKGAWLKGHFLNKAGPGDLRNEGNASHLL